MTSIESDDWGLLSVADVIDIPIDRENKSNYDSSSVISELVFPIFCGNSPAIAKSFAKQLSEILKWEGQSRCGAIEELFHNRSHKMQQTLATSKRIRERLIATSDFLTASAIQTGVHNSGFETISLLGSSIQSSDPDGYVDLFLESIRHVDWSTASVDSCIEILKALHEHIDESKCSKKKQLLLRSWKMTLALYSGKLSAIIRCLLLPQSRARLEEPFRPPPLRSNVEFVESHIDTFFIRNIRFPFSVESLRLSCLPRHQQLTVCYGNTLSTVESLGMMGTRWQKMEEHYYPFQKGESVLSVRDGKVLVTKMLRFEDLTFVHQFRVLKEQTNVVIQEGSLKVNCSSIETRNTHVTFAPCPVEEPGNVLACLISCISPNPAKRKLYVIPDISVESIFSTTDGVYEVTLDPSQHILRRNPLPQHNRTALHFVKGSCISVSRVALKDHLSSFCVEFWVYPRNASETQTIISVGKKRLEEIVLEIEPNGDGIEWRGGSRTPQLSGSFTTYISPGKLAFCERWWHVALNFTGTSWELWLGDRFVSHSPALVSPEPIRDAQIHLGKTFVGFITEVRVWNAARNATELFRDAHRHLTTQESHLLKAYYPLNEGQGDLLTDYSSNEEHALLHHRTASWYPVPDHPISGEEGGMQRDEKLEADPVSEGERGQRWFPDFLPLAHAEEGSGVFFAVAPNYYGLASCDAQQNRAMTMFLYNRNTRSLFSQLRIELGDYRLKGVSYNPAKNSLLCWATSKEMSEQVTMWDVHHQGVRPLSSGQPYESLWECGRDVISHAAKYAQKFIHAERYLADQSSWSATLPDCAVDSSDILLPLIVNFIEEALTHHEQDLAENACILLHTNLFFRHEVNAPKLLLEVGQPFESASELMGVLKSQNGKAACQRDRIVQIAFMNFCEEAQLLRMCCKCFLPEKAQVAFLDNAAGRERNEAEEKLLLCLLSYFSTLKACSEVLQHPHRAHLLYCALIREATFQVDRCLTDRDSTVLQRTSRCMEVFQEMLFGKITEKTTDPVSQDLANLGIQYARNLLKACGKTIDAVLKAVRKCPSAQQLLIECMESSHVGALLPSFSLSLPVLPTVMLSACLKSVQACRESLSALMSTVSVKAKWISDLGISLTFSLTLIGCSLLHANPTSTGQRVEDSSTSSSNNRNDSTSEADPSYLPLLRGGQRKPGSERDVLIKNLQQGVGAISKVFDELQRKDHTALRVVRDEHLKRMERHVMAAFCALMLSTSDLREATAVSLQPAFKYVLQMRPWVLSKRQESKEYVTQVEARALFLSQFEACCRSSSDGGAGGLGPRHTGKSAKEAASAAQKWKRFFRTWKALRVQRALVSSQEDNDQSKVSKVILDFLQSNLNVEEPKELVSLRTKMAHYRLAGLRLLQQLVEEARVSPALANIILPVIAKTVSDWHYAEGVDCCSSEDLFHIQGAYFQLFNTVLQKFLEERKQLFLLQPWAILLCAMFTANMRPQDFRQMRAEIGPAFRALWSTTSRADSASRRWANRALATSHLHKEVKLTSEMAAQSMVIGESGLVVKSQGGRGTCVAPCTWRRIPSPDDGEEVPPRTMYYYEVYVVDMLPGTSCSIGLGPTDYSLTRLPGWDPPSYALQSDEGVLCVNGRINGFSFSVGDVVGCGWNLSTKEVYWTKNGIFLVGTEAHQETFSPLIGFEGTGVAKVNFGEEPFIYSQKLLASQLEGVAPVPLNIRNDAWDAFRIFSIRAALSLGRTASLQEVSAASKQDLASCMLYCFTALSEELTDALHDTHLPCDALKSLLSHISTLTQLLHQVPRDITAPCVRPMAIALEEAADILLSSRAARFDTISVFLFAWYHCMNLVPPATLSTPNGTDDGKPGATIAAVAADGANAAEGTGGTQIHAPAGVKKAGAMSLNQVASSSGSALAAATVTSAATRGDGREATVPDPTHENRSTPTLSYHSPPPKFLDTLIRLSGRLFFVPGDLRDQHPFFNVLPELRQRAEDVSTVALALLQRINGCPTSSNTTVARTFASGASALGWEAEMMSVPPAGFSVDGEAPNATLPITHAWSGALQDWIIGTLQNCETLTGPRTNYALVALATLGGCPRHAVPGDTISIHHSPHLITSGTLVSYSLSEELCEMVTWEEKAPTATCKTVPLRLCQLVISDDDTSYFPDTRCAGHRRQARAVLRMAERVFRSAAEPEKPHNAEEVKMAVLNTEWLLYPMICSILWRAAVREALRLPPSILQVLYAFASASSPGGPSGASDQRQLNETPAEISQLRAEKVVTDWLCAAALQAAYDNSQLEAMTGAGVGAGAGSGEVRGRPSTSPNSRAEGSGAAGSAERVPPGMLSLDVSGSALLLQQQQSDGVGAVALSTSNTHTGPNTALSHPHHVHEIVDNNIMDMGEYREMLSVSNTTTSNPVPRPRRDRGEITLRNYVLVQEGTEMELVSDGLELMDMGDRVGDDDDDDDDDDEEEEEEEEDDDDEGRSSEDSDNGLLLHDDEMEAYMNNMGVIVDGSGSDDDDDEREMDDDDDDDDDDLDDDLGDDDHLPYRRHHGGRGAGGNGRFLTGEGHGAETSDAIHFERGCLRVSSPKAIGNRFTVDIHVRPVNTRPYQVLLLQDMSVSQTTTSTTGKNKPNLKLMARINNNRVEFGLVECRSSRISDTSDEWMCKTAALTAPGADTTEFSTTGRYLRLTFVQFGSTLSLYSEGVLQDTKKVPFSGSLLQKDLLFGGTPDDYSVGFVGDMHDIRIYEMALEPAMVTQLHSLNASLSMLVDSRLCVRVKVKSKTFQNACSALSAAAIPVEFSVVGEVGFLENTVTEKSQSSEVPQSAQEMDFSYDAEELEPYRIGVLHAMSLACNTSAIWRRRREGVERAGNPHQLSMLLASRRKIGKWLTEYYSVNLLAQVLHRSPLCDVPDQFITSGAAPLSIHEHRVTPSRRSSLSMSSSSVPILLDHDDDDKSVDENNEEFGLGLGLGDPTGGIIDTKKRSAQERRRVSIALTPRDLEGVKRVVRYVVLSGNESLFSLLEKTLQKLAISLSRGGGGAVTEQVLRLATESLEYLLEMAQREQFIRIYESTHPYRPSSRSTHGVVVAGQRHYQLYFDARCATSDTYFTFAADQSMFNELAQVPGFALSPFAVPLPRLFFNVRSDSGEPQWGYKVFVVYEYRAQWLAMRLFRTMLSAFLERSKDLSAFPFLASRECLTPLGHIARMHTGKTRRLALSCLTDLLMHAEHFLTSPPSFSCLHEIRRMTERRYRKYLSNQMVHSRFLQVVSECYLMYRDAQYCWADDDDDDENVALILPAPQETTEGVAETSTTGPNETAETTNERRRGRESNGTRTAKEAFLLRRQQQRAIYGERDGEERVKVYKVHEPQNMQVEWNAERICVTRSDDAGGAIIAATALTSGTWYYELRVGGSGELYVGVLPTRGGGAGDHECGNRRHGESFADRMLSPVAYNGRGVRYGNDADRLPSASQLNAWRYKDYVGVVLNIPSRTCSILINGEESELRFSFAHLQEEDGSDVVDADLSNISFCPYFAFGGAETFFFNFGGTHFEFEPPRGCLPLDPMNFLFGTLIPYNQIRAFHDLSAHLLTAGRHPIPPFCDDEPDPFVGSTERSGPAHVSLHPVEGTQVNGLEVKNTGIRFSTVMADCAVSGGAWYFEVTLRSQGLMQIGWAVKHELQDGSVGDMPSSWSIDLFRQLKWCNGKSEPVTVPRRWNVNDVIGCAIDLHAREMSFYFNGRRISASSATFRNLPLGVEYSPGISLRAGNHVTFNFGSTSFQYKPEGFQALGVPDSWCERMDTYYGSESRTATLRRQRVLRELWRDDQTAAPYFPHLQDVLRPSRMIVKSVDLFCQETNKNYTQMSEELLRTYLEKQGCTSTAILDKCWDQFNLLASLARVCLVVLPFLSLNTQHCTATTKLFLFIRTVLFRSVRGGLVISMLRETNVRMELMRLSINRRRAIDHQGNPRNTLFGQTLTLIADRHPRMFQTNKRMWATVLLGEGAEDVGGPYREHISSMCRELMSPTLPFFVPTANNAHNTGTYREAFVPAAGARSPFDVAAFTFVGRLMGAAMRSEEPLSLYFPPLVWKFLCAYPITEEDIADIDAICVQCVQEFRSIPNTVDSAEDFNEMFDEEFVTRLSDNSVRELIPGGGKVKVTLDRCAEYAERLLDARLHEFDDQLQWMREGLLSVVPEVAVLIFTPQELEQKICGKPDYRVEDLRKGALYDGITAEDRRVQFLWKALEDATPQQRRLFLRFVSGRERLPVKLRVLALSTPGDPNEKLPQAATCFFAIELPDYSSLEIMKQKLYYSIEMCVDMDKDFTTQVVDDGEGPRLMIRPDEGQEDGTATQED